MTNAIQQNPILIIGTHSHAKSSNPLQALGSLTGEKIDEARDQLVLSIHVEQKPPILKPASFEEELAEVSDGSDALKIGEGQPQEVFCTDANLAHRDLSVETANETECLGWHNPCRVDGVDDQVHDRILVGGLTSEALRAKRGYHANRNSPRWTIAPTFQCADGEQLPDWQLVGPNPPPLSKALETQRLKSRAELALNVWFEVMDCEHVS